MSNPTSDIDVDHDIDFWDADHYSTHDEFNSLLANATRGRLLGKLRIENHISTHTRIGFPGGGGVELVGGLVDEMGKAISGGGDSETGDGVIEVETVFPETSLTVTGANILFDTGWDIPDTDDDGYLLGVNTGRPPYLLTATELRALPTRTASQTSTGNSGRAIPFFFGGTNEVTGIRFARTSANRLLISTANSGSETFNFAVYRYKTNAVTDGGGGGGRDPRDPLSGEYLHLGTGAFNETLAEGSAQKTGLVAAQRGVFTATAGIDTTTIRFDNTLTGASVPGGAGNYNATNGQIITSGRTLDSLHGY